MPTSRRLLLHVGTHKTGTTSFQRALVEHRLGLFRAGLMVHVETNRRGRTIAECAGFGNSILRRSLRTGARMRGAQDVPTWRDTVSHAGALRAAMSVSGLDDGLVSVEALCFARTRAEAARMRASLRWAGIDEVVVLLVLREPASWRASWEAQTQRWADRARRDDADSESFEFGAGADNIRGDWYYDVDAIRSFWSRFGELRVVRYESALAEHGSVIPSLLSAMEQPTDLISKDYRLNRT